jgi:hypothetical protein
MIGLVSGLRFVLDKVAGAVDAELDDEAVLRERLLRAQLDLEEGRLTEAEFGTLEAQLFERLREIRAARGDEQLGAGSWSVERIEADAGSAPAKRRR